MKHVKFLLILFLLCVQNLELIKAEKIKRVSYKSMKFLIDKESAIQFFKDFLFGFTISFFELNDDFSFTPRVMANNLYKNIYEEAFPIEAAIQKVFEFVEILKEDIKSIKESLDSCENNEKKCLEDELVIIDEQIKQLTEQLKKYPKGKEFKKLISTNRNNKKAMNKLIIEREEKYILSLERKEYIDKKEKVRQEISTYKPKHHFLKWFYSNSKRYRKVFLQLIHSKSFSIGMKIAKEIMNDIIEKKEKSKQLVAISEEKDDSKKAVKFLIRISKCVLHKIYKKIDLIISIIHTLISLLKKPPKKWGLPIGSILGKISSLYADKYRTEMKQLNHNYKEIYSFAKDALQLVN